MATIDINSCLFNSWYGNLIAALYGTDYLWGRRT